jgi:hypothetical protein
MTRLKMSTPEAIGTTRFSRYFLHSVCHVTELLYGVLKKFMLLGDIQFLITFKHEDGLHPFVPVACWHHVFSNQVH